MTHGISSREPAMLKSPANKDPGMFGRMFDLLPLVVGDQALLELANAMKDSGSSPDDHIPTKSPDNKKIESGFTYLGQFIDHDMTLDLTSLSERADDREAVENFRTPTLDLDSIYGLGIEGSPHLYDRAGAAGRFQISAKFLLGDTVDFKDQHGNVVQQAIAGFDLPRSPATGFAIIGDPRNDENLLVAQIHVAFLRFHNAVVTKLSKEHPEWKTEPLFAEARKTVMWHYQWMVLHEFLEKLTGETGIAARIMRKGRRHYRFRKFPFMPVEFSAAAYRLGHSMVREIYNHNKNFQFKPDPRGTLGFLFDFTAKSGKLVGARATPAFPLPQPALPANWIVDWQRFFRFPGSPPDDLFNFTHRLDPFITPELHTLRGFGAANGENILPLRNLRRGVQKKLPSGQDVAREMDIRPMDPGVIATGPDGKVAEKHGLHRATPLWYYILKEAEQLGGGAHLGPVGATIVAETFVGLVQGSPSSYLSASPAFAPSLGAKAGTFTMVDLLNFAKFVNPLEDPNLVTHP
jgi:hypothetical protein